MRGNNNDFLVTVLRFMQVVSFIYFNQKSVT